MEITLDEDIEISNIENYQYQNNYNYENNQYDDKYDDENYQCDNKNYQYDYKNYQYYYENYQYDYEYDNQSKENATNYINEMLITEHEFSEDLLDENEIYNQINWDSTHAIQLIYHANYKQDNKTIRDIYNCKLYKEILEEELLPNDLTIVFFASLDGYQIFEQQCDNCWVILMINNNLSPEICVKKKLLVVAIISGPKQTKNFNTFIHSLVNKLKQLEGN
ncbi:transposase domain-containing protein [Gigaspora margarita]|uniref:Transposase domain-containing protein n=1 Tax=Gigaspora margarita TaxID=4874 RepID=A0A8H4AUJ0_GIGMA|nr:transposase domain-containing protein [Gigaspora margarita]